MKVFLSCTFVAFLTCCLPAKNWAQDGPKTQLSPAKMQEDFNLFRLALEEVHPGLYRYNRKPTLDSLFERTYSQLQNSLPAQKYYQLLGGLVNQIRCGHTKLLAPIKWFSQSAKVFPFGVFFYNQKPYIYLNATTEGENLLSPGSELLSINGEPATQVVQKLLDGFSADGYILSNKYGSLSRNWNTLYTALMPSTDTFSVEVRQYDSEKIVRQTVAAVTPQEWAKHAQAYPVSKQIWARINSRQPQKIVEFTWPNETTGLLTVRGFGDVKKESKMYESIFAQLNRRKAQNLIIDLRGNTGGSDKLGSELFGYLIDKPTRYYDSLLTITNTISFLRHTDKDEALLRTMANELAPLSNGTFLLNEQYEPGLRLQQPKPNHFTGKVYVLINGSSASTTSEFTSVVHANQLATFIGEESGGAYQGGNSGEFINLTLPNSKMQISIPIVRYQMATGHSTAEKGRGTMPDYLIEPSVEDVIENRDPVMAHALSLIKKQ